jgi:hypothetical protein
LVDLLWIGFRLHFLDGGGRSGVGNVLNGVVDLIDYLLDN